MTRVSDSVKSEFASVTGSQVMLLLLVWQPDLESLEGSSPPADKGGKNPCGCRCGPEVAHTRVTLTVLPFARALSRGHRSQQGYGWGEG